MDSQYFSKEGLEKLKEEYDRRTGALRAEITVRIKEAKEQGDLSENAEYSEAKEAQSLNEGRIEELKAILDNAVIISNGSKGGTVIVGSTVTVKSAEGERTFTIVGAAEADPASGKISNESPLGEAFLGHKKGESVTARTPKGEVSYTIVSVR